MLQENVTEIRKWLWICSRKQREAEEQNEEAKYILLCDVTEMLLMEILNTCLNSPSLKNKKSENRVWGSPARSQTYAFTTDVSFQGVLLHNNCPVFTRGRQHSTACCTWVGMDQFQLTLPMELCLHGVWLYQHRAGSAGAAGQQQNTRKLSSTAKKEVQ